MSSPRSDHRKKEKRERDWAARSASSPKPTNQTKHSSSPHPTEVQKEELRSLPSLVFLMRTGNASSSM